MTNCIIRSMQPYRKNGCQTQGQVSVSTGFTLTPAEKNDLQKYETLISAKLTAFFDVGRALLDIKVRKLYRQEFPTFEEYCRRRWDLNRSHAYRLVDAAEVCSKLSPMGDIPLPQTERQIRPLCGLPVESARRAWKRALEKAGAGKLSGAVVKAAILEVCPPKSKVQKTKQHWQVMIEPVLKEALQALRRGDKRALDHAIQRIELLLGVGERKISAELPEMRGQG